MLEEASNPSVLTYLAPHFEHYLTLHRVNRGQTYNYAARGFYGQPVIECSRHKPKCKIGESWLYVAIPADADLRTLGVAQRLYVGAQTQDRMFRGDGLSGENYHHAEMRAGNGADTPIDYLQAVGPIEIHRISETGLHAAVTSTADLSSCRPLLLQPRQRHKHCGYWFEQYILMTEPRQWRWNTQPAGAEVAAVLAASR